MPDSDAPDVIVSTTRTLQMIITALVTGLVIFLGVVVYLRIPSPASKAADVPAGAAPEPFLPVLTVTAITMAAVCLPLSFVLPGIVAEAACKKLAAAPPAPTPDADTAQVAALYQTQKILGAALGEGPAFLALVAYLVEGNKIALALGVLLIACVALRFPQREAVGRWVEDRLTRVRTYRETGRFS